MRRRQFLGAVGVALGTAAAGCGGLFETQSTRAPPLVENRPDAVYVPTHVEGMAMVGMAESGRYRFAVSYSFPHRFWTVTGDRTTQVEIREADTMHLMLTTWDGETGTVIPTANAGVTATKDGTEVVSDKKLWPMLSQNMGVHFGDNVALDGDGSYEVRADVGPVDTRLAGPLAGSLSEQASVSVPMEFSQAELDGLSFERLPDRQGERGAVDPMSMEMLPSGQVPRPADLPGERLVTGESGDATFVVAALPSVPEGVDGDGTYLAVSARTPDNRYPLPFMSLTATLSRDGEAVFDGELRDTVHPALGYHYGAVVDGVASGDALDLSVDAPPQVARHEGYETAFLDTEALELSL